MGYVSFLEGTPGRDWGVARKTSGTHIHVAFLVWLFLFHLVSSKMNDDEFGVWNIHTHTNVYIDIYIYIYTHTYTHIYIYLERDIVRTYTQGVFLHILVRTDTDWCVVCTCTYSYISTYTVYICILHILWKIVVRDKANKMLFFYIWQHRNGKTASRTM